jgi:class 3 adenylate cyclase
MWGAKSRSAHAVMQLPDDDHHVPETAAQPPTRAVDVTRRPEGHLVNAANTDGRDPLDIDISTLEIAEHVVMFVDMVGAIRMKSSGQNYRSSIPGVLSHNLEAIKAVTERLPDMRLPDGARRISESEISALKFIGDGAMILLPPGSELHAATIAAEILFALRKSQNTRERRIESCVGIASGEVLTDRSTYARDVNHFGEPIDVASRLVDIAAPDQILLDEHVYEAIQDEQFAEHFSGYGRRVCPPRPARLFETLDRELPIGMLANGSMTFETAVERHLRLDAKRHALRDRIANLMLNRDTWLDDITFGLDRVGWHEANYQLTDRLRKRFEELRDAADDEEYALSTDLEARLKSAYEKYEKWVENWRDGKETLRRRGDPVAEALKEELYGQLRTVFEDVKCLAQQYSRLLTINP